MGKRVCLVIGAQPSNLHNSIPDIDKKKFLAPADITVAKFVSEIRKHIKLGRQESLFVFVEGNVMPQPNATMSQVYAQHKDEDGFLYIVFSSENAFGCVSGDAL